MNDDITTIPERLREAAEDLPRMENKEDYWRVYNLMRNAADRIESLQAQLDAREYLDASAREVVRQIKPGFPALDRCIRNWGPRKFTVVAGWNGHGKSIDDLQVALRLATGQPQTGTAKAIAAGHDRALGMGPDDIADEDEP